MCRDRDDLPTGYYREEPLPKPTWLDRLAAWWNRLVDRIDRLGVGL